MYSSSLPVASTTTTLTPVRRPGSSPMVVRCPAGAASNRSRMFSPNTRMASSSAASRRRRLSSDSICILILMRQAQRAHSPSHGSAARASSRSSKCAATMDSQIPRSNGDARSSCPGTTIFRRSTLSLRPRYRAKARCDGTFFKASENSK